MRIFTIITGLFVSCLLFSGQLFAHNYFTPFSPAAITQLVQTQIVKKIPSFPTNNPTTNGTVLFAGDACQFFCQWDLANKCNSLFDNYT